MSGGASTQLELLYVKKNYEALYKDVQKKDSRNDLLARELKEARAKRDETQRELRLLEAVFEKVNHDKIHLEMELKKVKDMGRNIPPNGGGGNKSHETRKLEYDLRLKERRIDQLEKEVSHLKTSNSLREASFSQLAAHNNASSSSIADGNTNNAPEVVISSLCEELGKQKTDAHGLALTLAEMHHDLMQSQSDCLQVSEVNANVNTKVLSLEEENKRLTRLTAKQMSEIASLHKQNSEEVKINGKLGLQIEELSARLHSERNASLAEILALKQTCDAQKVELEDADAEKELLREKISALNASHANLMVMFRMTEELISVERQHSKEHQWDLEESTKAKRKLEEALAALQGNLAQAVERNKELERCLKEQADKQREWEKERDDHRSRVSELLDEIDLLKAQREEALEALRNCIASIKDISRKLSVEREGR